MRSGRSYCNTSKTNEFMRKYYKSARENGARCERLEAVGSWRTYPFDTHGDRGVRGAAWVRSAIAIVFASFPRGRRTRGSAQFPIFVQASSGFSFWRCMLEDQMVTKASFPAMRACGGAPGHSEGGTIRPVNRLRRSSISTMCLGALPRRATSRKLRVSMREALHS